MQDMNKKLESQKTHLDRIDAAVKKLEFRSSRERNSALAHNVRTINGNDPLRPVPHPDTGLLPPLALEFPANLNALRSMRADAVDGLLGFYSIMQEGAPVKSRRRMLAEELGRGHAC